MSRNGARTAENRKTPRRYDAVLLLDADTIVVGSLAHLFAPRPACGASLSPPDAPDGARCWAEIDADVCAGTPLALAQQTVGTPILTAFFLAYPEQTAWEDLAEDLERVCGGPAVCNKKRIYASGAGWEPKLLCAPRGARPVEI